MKPVFSRIYGSEIRLNTSRKFGSSTIYFVAYLHGSDGIEPILLTEKDIEIAKKRAIANKEDVPPPNRSWLRESLYRLFGKLK